LQIPGRAVSLGELGDPGLGEAFAEHPVAQPPDQRGREMGGEVLANYTEVKAVTAKL
jgi:hypothetical protein